jgi:hypothetical protein
MPGRAVDRVVLSPYFGRCGWRKESRPSTRKHERKYMDKREYIKRIETASEIHQSLSGKDLNTLTVYSLAIQSLPNLKMFAKSIITVLTLAVAATATLNPATSNTKGKYPSSPGCSGPLLIRR